MSRRPIAALLVGAFLASLAACIAPVHDPDSYPTLSSVNEGDKPADVRKAMGAPDAVATGWWRSAFSFDSDYQVWYYAKKGRVVFDQGSSQQLTVFTSEADESEDGRP